MSIKVKDLLNEKIAVKYNDRLFWYAKNVQIINDNVEIYIENSSLVTFDDINDRRCTSKSIKTITNKTK